MVDLDVQQVWGKQIIDVRDISPSARVDIISGQIQKVVNEFAHTCNEEGINTIQDITITYKPYYDVEHILAGYYEIELSAHGKQSG